MIPDGRSAGGGGVVGRVIAGVVSTGAGALWLSCVFLVLSSRFSAAGDPHGYGLIFGTLLAVVTGLLFALALPFTFPRQRRPRIERIAMATYAVTTVLLFAAWFSA